MERRFGGGKICRLGGGCDLRCRLIGVFGMWMFRVGYLYVDLKMRMDLYWF